MDSVSDVASPTAAAGRRGLNGHLELLTRALLPTGEAETGEGVTGGEFPAVGGVDRTGDQIEMGPGGVERGRSRGRRGSWVQLRRFRRRISGRQSGSRGGEVGEGEGFWPKLMIEEGSAAMVFALGAVISTPSELSNRWNLLAAFYTAQMVQFLLGVVLLILYIDSSRGPSRRLRCRCLAKAVMIATFAPVLASIAIVLYAKLKFPAGGGRRN